MKIYIYPIEVFYIYFNRNHLNCKLGFNIEDSIEHCMNCDILNQYLGNTHFKIGDISNNYAELQKKSCENIYPHKKMQGQIYWTKMGPTRAR